MFLGIAGTYRKNDSVDVVYQVGGRRVVATGLRVMPAGRGLTNEPRGSRTTTGISRLVRRW